mgnify:CR=1 FL=1
MLGAVFAQTPSVPTALKTVHDYFEVGLGDKVVRLQFAVTGPEMQRGLMFRESLGPDEGMIFVYDKPQAMSFWMHNTPLPLHIGFFDAEGVLKEYYPLFPYDENTVKSRGDKLQYAVEVRQGWFRENKIVGGARLDLKAVAAALKARGFDPTKYGLPK